MQTGELPHVVYVVVNWNQCQLTLDCLASLRTQDYSRFDVVVVDNGSDDGSVAAIRTAFPAITVLENPRNLGIAAANNVGIRQALAAGADYVFLLNNDTVVDPQMLGALVRTAEASPQVAVTGPTMLYFDQPETIWCAGNRIDWRDGSTWLLRNGEPVGNLAAVGPTEVDYIATCAACFRRSALEAVGPMDERYFIYYDETDWFARAHALGWRFVHVPEARMWHKVSASMRPASPATTYYMVRNRLLFLAKNASGVRRLRLMARALGQELRTLAAHSLRARHRHLRGSRDARWLALRDALRGRFGPMGQDVAAVCARAAS
jgi:GT2 family glycosyltransferase